MADVATDAADVTRQLEAARERERAVSQVLRAVARSDGLQPVFDAVVEAANRLCRGESSGLWLADGDVFRVVSLIEYKPGNLEYEREHPHVPGRDTLTGRVILTRDVVNIPDVLADPEYNWAGQSDAGFRSMLGVPVFVDDDLIGVLAVTRATPGRFDDDEVSLITTFADQAAIAIANARLIDTTQRQLEQQQAVGDVLRAIALSESLEDVFQAVVDAATRLCRADFGGLYLQGDDGAFRVVSKHEWNLPLQEFDREHPVVADRTTAVGRVALTRDVVHIADVEADQDYAYGGRALVDFRAVLAAPVLVEDELIGAIFGARHEAGPFADAEIQLMRTFADQAAIAIANARLIDAVERQRTELSRFVSPQVAELVSSDEGEKLLTGHRAYISCLFCDLRGFTSFTETAEPEELFDVLREYHRALGELIPKYEGTLEHFAGDGLMVFFNDPAPVEDHELKAVSLALAAQERFHELAFAWRKRGTELGLGIGIAAGYATLGRIGFEGRYDYGALGPVNNLASRLSTVAAPGQTLISQRVHAAVEDAVETQQVGELELKGFGRPVVAYEVRGVVQSAS